MAKKSAKSKGYRRQHAKKPYLTKRDIAILCVLVVAVIVAAALLFSYDDGALKVTDGRIAEVGENWLIVNGSNTAGRARYFKVGEIGELDGYARVNAPLSDANVPQYVFTPQEEADGVASVSVTTSHAGAKQLADYVVKTMSAVSGANLSEVAEAEANGQGYFYYTSVIEPPAEETPAEGEEASADEAPAEAEAPAEGAEASEPGDSEEVPAEDEAPAEEEAPVEEAEPGAEAAADDEAEPAVDAPAYTTTLNAYADCTHDSCVAIEVRATADSREALPDEAALKAVAEQTLAAITLEQGK